MEICRIFTLCRSWMFHYFKIFHRVPLHIDIENIPHTIMIIYKILINIIFFYNGIVETEDNSIISGWWTWFSWVLTLRIQFRDAQYKDIYAYISHWSLLWLLLHKFESTAFPVPYLNSFSLRAFIKIWHAFLAIFIHLNIFIHVRFYFKKQQEATFEKII